MPVRSPFEKTEAEEFLTREALEVYYHRTTTGNFFGDYIISLEFEDLIKCLVAPDVTRRVASAGKALRHKFFDPAAGTRVKSCSSSSSRCFWHQKDELT